MLTKKLLKKSSLILAIGALLPLESNAFYNMAYVETNSNSFSNVGCYILSGTKKTFFDMASIFAANINGSNPNNPEIYINPGVKAALANTSSINKLHKQGIKVLLTVLGNHQNAGWSCITQRSAAKKFAANLANITAKYNLDGIDIDDEYSTCAPNDYSMTMIAKYLKENPKFKGKILTKALFNDYQYFQSDFRGHKLSDYLDYGWEMGYGSGGPSSRLSPYQGYGMSKNSLALGVSTSGSPSLAAGWISEAMKDGYGGAMVYNITKNSQPYLSKIAMAEYHQLVEVTANCLE